MSKQCDDPDEAFALLRAQRDELADEVSRLRGELAKAASSQRQTFTPLMFGGSLSLPRLAVATEMRDAAQAVHDAMARHHAQELRILVTDATGEVLLLPTIAGQPYLPGTSVRQIVDEPAQEHEYRLLDEAVDALAACGIPLDYMVELETMLDFDPAPSVVRMFHMTCGQELPDSVMEVALDDAAETLMGRDARLVGSVCGGLHRLPNLLSELWASDEVAGPDDDLAP